MARYCDDCIHKDVCRFEASYNRFLNATKQDLEDFTEVFEVQLMSMLAENFRLKRKGKHKV